MSKGKSTRSRKRKRTRTKPFAHLKSIGFTNRLSLYILILLAGTILMGFFLALKSISTQYIGSLACFTVAVAPMDSILGIVLKSAVQKSAAENTEGGINYFKASTTTNSTVESFAATAVDPAFLGSGSSSSAGSTGSTLTSPPI